ncbi:hypothetical protein PspLS_03299 [Pyricularia sp. CBS 133598]|nr:hypothetical protein PspLS_03299 [Pyricularia sp. CBS 133598]
MAPLPDFNSRDRFPTFVTIPEAGAPVSDGGQEEWYLLAHIKNDMTIAKPTLVVEDRDGSPFAVVFEGYGRDDLDLKARGLKKGNTIVMPRARRVPPADETKRGFVRVDKADANAVKAVPGALERILALGGVEEDATVCSACGGKGEGGGGLSRCVGCGRARYCGKECQVKGWNESHKVYCKIFKGLDAIFG